MKADSKGQAMKEFEDEDDFIPIDFRRLALSTFILWQIMTAALWLLPQSVTQSSFVIPLRHYMWMVGCDQNWGMFAPNPANADVYVTAQITYQDGTQKEWTYPRMHDLGYVRRYQEERYRKMLEWAHQPAYARMWPWLARFAAQANNDHARTNPVTHVELILHTMNIPNPGVPLPPYTAQTFYQTDFKPGSLPQ
jgi:hypothetical protein